MNGEDNIFNSLIEETKKGIYVERKKNRRNKFQESKLENFLVKTERRKTRTGE